jgi:hypothetical protein
MSLGNVLGAAAPIAAGYFAPGAGAFLGNATANAVAAGALTGAGIAALQGDDVLMGAASGGLGGYGGGNLATAFNPATAAVPQGSTTAVMNKELMSPFTTPASNAVRGNLGMFSNPTAVSPAATQGVKGLQGSIGPNMSQINKLSPTPGQIANPTTKFASKVPGIPDAGSGGYKLSPNEIVPPAELSTMDKFSAGIERLGGGDKVAGYGKLALTAAPVVGAGLIPDYGNTVDDNPMNRYDPSRRLDLSMDTGIDKALAKDSGLRLLANGGYLDGGMLPGDGMSDDVPAMIDGEQEAALSQGEFVIPADVVSHLGNGSSDAGSQRLYQMMDEVRRARTGKKEQGKEINAERYMPS